MLTRRVLLVVLSVPAFIGLTAIPAAATTFTVNSAADPGTGVCDVTECTLREAITAANVDATQDEIQFNVTPNTITLASQLPFVFQPLIIDGTTDPDSSRVRIDGSAVANDSHGLHFETSGTSAVRGLEIIGVPGSGGLGILGSISGGGTLTVGGTGANEGNVLSGNGGRGLFLQGFGGTYVVQGNIIGLQSDGTTVQANGSGGALVQGNNSVIGGITGVTPGGSCTGACNLISGNTGVGLNISGAGVTVQGNYIGTDVTGLLDRGNQSAGIAMGGTISTLEVIGGDTPAERNVISGNDSSGINFSDINAGLAEITGNYIGVGSNGTTSLGNGGNGILLGGDDVTVGGTAAGAGNVIANNGGAGARIFDPGIGGDPTAHDDAVRGNSIFANAGLGIDLGPEGLTANDVGDGDTGSNGLQNFPVIAAAEVTGSVVAVQGSLNSAASTTFDIDVYANTACNAVAPNDHGEGRTYLGSTTAVTDGSGNASLSFTSSGSPSVSLGDVITATATDPNSNTSEFSKCKTTTAPQPDLSINDVTVTEGNAGTVTAGFTVTRSGDTSGAVSVNFATANGTATAPGDYQSTSGTVSFLAGETTKPVDVTVNGDVLDEPDETFAVNLSNAVGADIIDGSGQGTITDDDATPSISIDDVGVMEGNMGTVTASFTVTLSSQSGGTVTVDYDTADGTAVAPADYAAESDTLSIPATETSGEIEITVNADLLDEPNETFTVNLSNAQGATIGDTQAQGTITDDDVATIAIADATVSEGNSGTVPAAFTVTLSTQSASPVTVDWDTANGSATSPSDYTSGNGTVMFAPMDSTETITVAVNGDTTVEPNETFLVNLSNGVNATINDGQGTGTISNDDAQPRCPGFESDQRPQLVGTEGVDTLIGTSATEIICGLGGNDVLKGGGGKDLVLGGGGNDRMAGQGGKDVLKGQAGNDKMNGGPGVDRCQGGPGKDSAKACEKGRA